MGKPNRIVRTHRKINAAWILSDIGESLLLEAEQYIKGGYIRQDIKEHYHQAVHHLHELVKSLKDDGSAYSLGETSDDLKKLVDEVLLKYENDEPKS